jgi:hypothetical protein
MVASSCPYSCSLSGGEQCRPGESNAGRSIAEDKNKDASWNAAGGCFAVSPEQLSVGLIAYGMAIGVGIMR